MFQFFTALALLFLLYGCGQGCILGGLFGGQSAGQSAAQPAAQSAGQSAGQSLGPSDCEKAIVRCCDDGGKGTKLPSR